MSIDINIGNLASCCPEISQGVTSFAVGEIRFWPSNTAPSTPGWALLNGFSFDPALYPELAKLYPENKVSDPRGLFLRAMDAHNLHDSDGSKREIGSVQLGSCQGCSGTGPFVKIGNLQNNFDIVCFDRGEDLVSYETDIEWCSPYSRGSFTSISYDPLGRSRPSNMAMNLIMYTGLPLSS
ncbi:phage tail protein [Acetobacteraceae bacterium ESL0709]|nr:phage tail protein [Acetobacteraceae bacterium ESL0697]MDF7677751.1 phage tail protein [Acetobacteraceae bacterium ESL0709]MDF7677761.1 phage tail protein [Acetobacteraceae bacterium ESL0709]